ncbi:hypothetical protein [Methylorubrum zatmanii]
MSEAFTPLSAPEAVAAAHRIFERADTALSLRRALDGVPSSDLISIVILARQLDEIARAAAAYAADGKDFEAWDRLRELLAIPGYLPLPQTHPAEEPAHGEG